MVESSTLGTSKDDFWPTVFHEGSVVGCLEEKALLTPGIYRYMLYRDQGHYRITQILRNGGQPRCSCLLDGSPFEFLVLGSLGC